MSAQKQNAGKKIFADQIRMLAKSIYDAADDIAGTTDGCVEISISFDIETAGFDPRCPTYTVERRHYPRKDLIDEFIGRIHDTAETEVTRLPYPELTCKTCIYGDEDDSIYCATCTRNKDFVSHDGHTDNWRVR